LPKLPRVSGRQIAAALRRLGFRDKRQKGSHLVLTHEDGRRAVVPQHGSKVVLPATLLSILEEAGVSREELRGAL